MCDAQSQSNKPRGCVVAINSMVELVSSVVDPCLTGWGSILDVIFCFICQAFSLKKSIFKPLDDQFLIGGGEKPPKKLVLHVAKKHCFFIQILDDIPILALTSTLAGAGTNKNVLPMLINNQLTSPMVYKLVGRPSWQAAAVPAFWKSRLERW